MRHIGPPSSRRDDIRRELEAHVRERADELRALGHPDHVADQMAREEFGSTDTVERTLRGIARRRAVLQRMGIALSAGVQDLRLAFRGLRRQPAFTVLAVLALGLGIGATTAIFSVVYGVLLRPLNYENPDRLVTLWAAPREGSVNGSPSYPDFVDWQRSATVFDGVAFLRGTVVTIVDDAMATQDLTTAEVTPDFVRVLGAQPALGSLAPLAAESTAEPVVVLKHETWVSRFGADSSVVGTTVNFTNGPHRIVAVMARGVDYPLWAHVYTPLTQSRIANQGLDARDYRLDNRVIARLGPSVTPDAARTEMQTIASRLAIEYPATNADWTVSIMPLDELLIGNVRSSLYVLFAGVFGLLLIACSNVANLSLARTLARGPEMAIRASLGAGRARLIRQLLTESTVLGLIGGVVGIVLARWGLSGFLAWGIPGLPRADDIVMDYRVLAFALAISGGSVLFFGLAPALLGTRANLISAIKQQGAAPASDWIRSLLVGGQVAITVVLMAAAALLAKSFTSIQNTDPGFDPQGLVTLRLNLPERFQGQPAARAELYRRVLEAAETHPAFAAATIVNHLPLAGRGVTTPLEVDGLSNDVPVAAWLRLAGPDYFEVVGLPVVAGRSFDAGDHRNWSGGMLMSESFARQLFGGADPLGRRVTAFKQVSGDPDYGQPLHGRIIGIVGDTRNTMRALEPTPSVYLPMSVHPWPTAMLTVRARPGVDGLGDALRGIVREIDPDIPTLDISPLTEIAAVFVGRDRFLTVFAAAFSTVAALLALVGVYGVMSFNIRRRSRELGIRVALGASRLRVGSSVLIRAGRVIAAGIILGLVGVGVVTRYMTSVLYRTSPLDLTAVGAAAFLMVLLGMLGAWFPAQRAGRTDPMRILREE